MRSPIPIAIIDGDNLAWTVAFYARPADCPARVVAWMARVVDATGAGQAIVCFGDPSRRYFRHELLPTYKSRLHDPPASLDAAKAAIREQCVCRSLEWLEADDVMGILATHFARAGRHAIIVSDDKDLLTIPGHHYNPRTKLASTVSEEYADRRHMLQTLTGDAGDGYPGCPGVGPVKAEKILNGTICTAWDRVVLAFKGKGLTEEDALRQSRLARILRVDDYDIPTCTVNLWMPRREPAREVA